MCPDFEYANDGLMYEYVSRDKYAHILKFLESYVKAFKKLFEC